MDARVAAGTRTAYRKAYDNFHAFVTRSAQYTTRTPSDIDNSLKEYLKYLFESGRYRSAAEKAFCAVLFYHPNAKGSLHFSAAMLKGWRNLQPSDTKPPLTWSIVVLLASTMASYGHFDAGLATLVGFDCLLRISEFSNFRVNDVIRRDNRIVGPAQRTVLRIRKAKTGNNQDVSIMNDDVEHLLMTHLERCGRAPSEKLFAFTGVQYREIVKQCLIILKLDHLGFTPHSLRHGGATHMLRQQHPVSNIIVRGRWSPTSTTIVTYLQQAAAASLDLTVSDTHMEHANKILREFRSHMSAVLFPAELLDVSD